VAGTRVDWLRDRLAAGKLPLARLELVARLSDADAAAALGTAPGPEVDLYVSGNGVVPSLDPREAVIALAHAVEGVARWWRRERLAEPRFLEPIDVALTAATRWASGAQDARPLEAARHLDRVLLVLAFEGREPDRATHERAFALLARAAVSVAYVAAPPGEPLAVATPWEPVVERSRKNAQAEREDRLREARDRVHGAIAGRAELELVGRRSDEGYADLVEERARSLRAELQRTLAARLLV
jgi:hypothetical protein